MRMSRRMGALFGSAMDADWQYLALGYETAFHTPIIYKRSADTLTRLPDPVGATGARLENCTFSPGSNYLAMVSSSFPYIGVYKRNGDAFAKLATQPQVDSQVAYAVQGCAFSLEDDLFVVGHTLSPHFMTIFKRNGDAFIKLANPAASPSGPVRGCAFSPDGVYMVAAHQGSPYMSIYKRSGNTFTKLAAPAVLPGGHADGCTFSPGGGYFAIWSYAFQATRIYKHNGDTFTHLTSFASYTDSRQGCAFSPDGVYLAMASGSRYMSIYKRNGDAFVRLPDPEITPNGPGRACAFSPDGGYLAVGYNSGFTPNYVGVMIYKRIGDTFTKLENPAGLLVGQNVISCAFG